MKVYDYGSADNVGMSFDREHNLLLSLSRGQVKESKMVVVPDIQTHFDKVDPVTKEIHFSESFPQDSIIK